MKKKTNNFLIFIMHIIATNNNKQLWIIGP